MAVAKTGVVNVRIDAHDKRLADSIMAKMGMTPTEVIRLLYRQITLQRAIPFEIALPPETAAAIDEIENGGGTYYASVQDIMNDPDLR